MAISASGIGSNLDVESIVSQLMSVERQPLTRLSVKSTQAQSQISAFGQVKSALASFQSTMAGLTDVKSFQGMKASSSDSTIVSVSADATASPGTHSIDVRKLAQNQNLNTSGVQSAQSAIGQGVITFDFGEIKNGTLSSGKYTGASFESNGLGSKSVTIDSSNQSLSGIRDAINKAGIGVTASIVNAGGATPYHLVLTNNATGKQQSMKISVSGDAALGNLLNHNPASATVDGQALTETQTAQDSELYLDGIFISKSSNNVSDAIEGVTLSLSKESTTKSTITIDRDNSKATAAVTQFVGAYNALSKVLTDVSAYNRGTKVAAPLNGDSTIASIQNQFRGILGTPMNGVSSTYHVLSEIGISSQKDGSLSIDATKLKKVLDSDPAAVASLFANAGKTSDSLISYSSATSATKTGEYKVNISQIATQGAYTGSSASGLTVTSGVNDYLLVNVDGVNASVILSEGTYDSYDALAKEMQSKINGAHSLSSIDSSVTVTNNAGKLTIQSNKFGADSSVDILGGSDTNYYFGSSSSKFTGQNAGGSIDGFAATGSGQFLTGGKGSTAEGLKIQVNGGSAPSDRGTVTYTQGYASQFNKLASSMLDNKGMIASKSEGLDYALKLITDRSKILTDRLADVEKRYRAQYVKLDTTISSMQQTQTYLSQQLAKLGSAN